MAQLIREERLAMRAGCKTSHSRLHPGLVVPQATEWQRIGNQMDTACAFGLFTHLCFETSRLARNVTP